ncbi:MAG TPA: creatininase family protein [Gemmatimonadales bacterium]|nr:creatininase family protein [Gemmatimonadales bacterium]
MNAPLPLKTLIPDDVGRALERDPRLLVPVGTCEQHGPHLPLGCDTLIVERLADDLSAAFQILRAPTVEYGVNTEVRNPRPGDAAVRRKTLHRWMNELLGSWELAGVDAFIILTAHGYDPHQEALSTLRTRRARILMVDVFALDFTAHLDDPVGPFHGSELDTSLLLHVAPGLVQMRLARDNGMQVPGGTPAQSAALASAAKGERLYKMIYERIASQVVDSAA